MLHRQELPALDVAKAACGQEVHPFEGCAREHHRLMEVHVVMVPSVGMDVALMGFLAMYQGLVKVMTCCLLSPLV